MARSNNATAGNYLSNTAAAVTAAPLTMAAWFNPVSVTEDHILISCSRSSSSDNWFFLAANGVTAGDPIAASTITGGTEALATTSTSFVANTWQHACGVWSAANSRAAYLNGGGVGTNSTSLTPTGIDRTYVGRLTGFDGSLYGSMNAAIAEAAIWNVALTAAEVLQLAKGLCPLLVRPASLVCYWPIYGRASPEPDLADGLPLTISGTMAQAAHTRVFMPCAPIIGFQTAAGAPGTTSKVMTDTFDAQDGFVRYAFRPRDRSEVLSISDASVSGAKRFATTTENVSLTDESPHWASRYRRSDEAIALTDGFVSWRRLARLSQDNLDLLDGSSRSVIGSGTVYGRTLSDTLSLTDGFVSWRRLVRLLTDNADLLDGFSKAVVGAGITYARVLSDTTTLIDDAGTRWTLRNSRLTEAIGLSDSLLRALARIRILGENIEYSDGAIRFLRSVRVPTESLDITDELVRAYFPDQIFTVALVFGTSEQFRISTYDPMMFSARDSSLRFGGH